jgi:hypothetical protein
MHRNQLVFHRSGMFLRAGYARQATVIRDVSPPKLKARLPSIKFCRLRGPLKLMTIASLFMLFAYASRQGLDDS